AVEGMRPALYSHKGALGHSLGAAGLVSVVINRMCHEKNLLPPMLGENLMAAKNVELSESSLKRRVRRSIAIAAGFGGAMGVVSLLGSEPIRHTLVFQRVPAEELNVDSADAADQRRSNRKRSAQINVYTLSAFVFDR